MIVKPVLLTDFIETNAYFYVDEKTKRGFLIDPAAQADVLLQMIEENGLTIEKMLITHGHFDHIGAVQALHDKLNIPYVAHENGREYCIVKHICKSESEKNAKVFIRKNTSLFQQGRHARGIICIWKNNAVCIGTYAACTSI